MESLHARKLSNANSFSGKNAYDGVFSGRQKYGAPVLSSNVEDYREIFGRSQASSIPVLNLSAFDESSVSSSFRSSKPDYSKIFGGFRADEDDSVVSYDELFGGAKNSSEKARTPPSTRPPLQNADKLCSQPSDGLKQFNMSYHKTPQKSKNGPDGTTHVAQLHAVPGFTCFIDETPLPPEMQSEKQKSSLANNLYSDVDCRNAVPTSKSTKKAVQDLPNKQSSGNIVKSGSRNNKNESSLDDKLVNEYEVDLKSHPPKVPSPPSEQFNLDNRDAYRERSMASNSRVSKSDTSENAHGKFSHPSSDDELDVNSAAAASVAALRKAIQKAQESIRIAKESVGRKKEGLRSFSNLSFKDSLKVEGKMDNLAACGGQNFKDNDAKEFEGVNAASEDFLKLERNYKHGNGVVYPGLKDREKLFVAKKVITEMHGKILESAKTCPIATSSSQINGNKIVSDSREATGDVDPKILESAEPVFYSGLGSMGRNATQIGKVDNKYNNRCTDDHEFKFVENRASNETLEQDVVLKSLESVEETSELEDHETKRDDGKIAQELEGEMEKQESAWFVHGDKHNGNLGAGKDYEPSNKKQNVIYAHENFVEKLQENEETMEDVSDVPIELEENSDKDTPSNTNNTVIDENSLNEFKRMASEEVVQDQSTETDFNEKKQNVVPEQEFVEVGNESGVANICNKEEHEKEFEEAFQQVVHENELNNDLVTNSNERREEESHKGEKNEKRLDEVHELEINENRQANAHKIEGSEANLKEVYHLKQNYEHEGEEIVNRLDDVHETKINDNSTDASDMEGSEDSLEDKVDFSGDSAKVVEAKTYNTSVSIPCESYESEEDMEMWASQEVVLKKSSDLDCDACSNYASDDETEPQEAWKEEADNKMGTSEEFDDNSESSIEDSGSLYEFKADDAEVTSVAHELERELFSQTAPEDQTATEDNEIKFVVNILFKGHHSDDNSENSCLAEADLGQREGEQSGLSSDSETAANGSKEDAENMEDRSSVGEEEEIILEDKFVVGGYKEEHNVERANEGTPLVEKPNGTEASHIHKDVDEKENAMDTNEEIKEGEYKEEKEELKETGLEEVGGKEYLRKIDEATEKEREREREKVRLAVERAIREARERAFAEARERAERAAVEKATAEVRQRAMTGARIKLEKNSAATKSSAATKTSAEIKKPSDKDAVDAKLRAERAAVERATAEARERALKAMSQKSNSGTSKDTITTTSSSSDLHGSNGKVSESAQRSKEELEKHNRIMERTAKALAEKEKRDLLARKEQVEKNRLAETLDADIKRWSSGKEGNLRALLSTLQYILGPDSGWQPVTLTEIITTNAIKKAYRKATLCVHPDKLQQRGASIQQKYVCEKVFDLLKAAWNKFNAEER